MSKVANLGSFIASKKDATPAALEEPAATKLAIVPEAKPESAPVAPTPAAQPKAVKPPKAVEPELKGNMVMLNVRVTPKFRKELKLYAVQMDRDMSEIIREGVALYRKKHGEPQPE